VIKPRETDQHRIEFGAGRMPVRRPPALKPGQKLRVLHRGKGEDYAGATVRAQRMPWWARVVPGGPYSTAAVWIWVVTA